MRLRRWEVHDGGWGRTTRPPFAVSCCDECWEDGDGVLEVKHAVVVFAEVDIDGGSNPAARDE